MSTMRRRQRQTPDDDSELRRGLLTSPSEEHEEAEPRASGSQIIVYPGPFDLFSFVAFIAKAWQNALNTVITFLWPAKVHDEHVTLTAIQEDRLDKLRSRVSIKYDPEDSNHQDVLVELWKVAFPDIECPGLKHESWKEMGWQSDDPSRDFRGAGFLGVQNLLYFGKAYPAHFRRLMNKATGTRAQWEYPFGAAGMNLTFTMTDILELSKTPSATSTVHVRNFLVMLEDNEDAFEEVYCAAFIRLDQTWLDMKASYMQFNEVLQTVKKQVQKALAERDASLPSVKQSLGL